MYQTNYYDEYRDGNSKHILKSLSIRIAIKAVIWIIIGIMQLISGIFGLGFVVIILGLLNFLGGIVDLLTREKVFKERKGIVVEHKLSGGEIATYFWNGLIGILCLIVGDIFTFLLILAAIFIDFFLIKLYVIFHKEEFLRLEQEQIWQEQIINNTSV